jgi:hypothetical protein
LENNVLKGQQRPYRDYIVKHINQNSSLQEGQSLYLAGLFSNPETVKMLNQNGMLDCSCLVSTQEEGLENKPAR